MNTLIVGYDAEPNGIPVLVVGEKDIYDRKIEVINAIQGDEATEIWERLRTVKDES